jgi:short-subunit dehydrogenase
MNKVVLITGASSGIGKSIAEFLHYKGFVVYGTSRNPEKFRNSVIPLLELDVRNTDSIQNAVKKVIELSGTIDIVINNAGVGITGPIEEIPTQEIKNNFETNFFGPIEVMKAVLPQMRAQKSGLIINITSIAGLVNLPLGNFYHPTKHAVESFSECMSYELKEANIKICTVQFGNIATHFQQNVHLEADKKWASNNKLKRMIAQFLAKRTGKNKQLIAMINNKIFSIAVHPASNFKRYTIGFDARLLKTLRNLLGYQLFGAIIRLKIANYTKKIEAS